MRVPIPEQTAVQVLFEHDHTCCICNEPGKGVQIHHIDDDNTNPAYENLAVLCLQDHNDTQISGGFGRKLSAAEVTKYRDEWIRRVGERRAQADRFVVERMVGLTQSQASSPPTSEAPPPQKLLVYVNSLPNMFQTAVNEGEKMWINDREGVVPGTHLIIDILAEGWVQLAAWIDPYHFGSKSPREYISEYIATRNSWNRMLVEPSSYGWRARSGTIETLDYTLVDVQRTATRLTSEYLTDFDHATWRKRWTKPKYIG